MTFTSSQHIQYSSSLRKPINEYTLFLNESKEIKQTVKMYHPPFHRNPCTLVCKLIPIPTIHSSHACSLIIPAVIIWGCQLRYQLFTSSSHIYKNSTIKHTYTVILSSCCFIFSDCLSAFSSVMLLFSMSLPTLYHLLISLSRVISHHHRQCLDSV